MRVSHTGGFNPGPRVKVALGNGSERQAIVQWTKDGFAGLYLFDDLSVMELGDPASLGLANHEV